MRPTFFLVAVVVASIMVVNAYDGQADGQENEGEQDPSFPEAAIPYFGDVDNNTYVTRNDSLEIDGGQGEDRGQGEVGGQGDNQERGQENDGGRKSRSPEIFDYADDNSTDSGRNDSDGRREGRGRQGGREGREGQEYGEDNEDQGGQEDNINEQENEGRRETRSVDIFDYVDDNSTDAGRNESNGGGDGREWQAGRDGRGDRDGQGETRTEQENEGGYDTRLTDDIVSDYTDDNATDASRNGSRGDGVGDREDERRIDLGEFPRGPDGPSNAGFLGFKVAYARSGDSNSSLDRYEGTFLTWNRSIGGADNDIMETAYIGAGYIAVTSFDAQLENSTFVRYTTVVYDFTGNVSFAVVLDNTESSPCYFFNIFLSFDEAVEQLKRINGTQLETSNQESYIASSTPLTTDERDELEQSSSIVNVFCGDTEIVRTRVTYDWYGPPDVSLEVLNDVVDIYYEETVSKRTEERRRGRGGQSGSDGGGTDISDSDRGDERRPSLRHHKDSDSDESNESKHHSRKNHKDRKSKESKHRSGRRHKRTDSESNESNESRD
uniref:Uncharacterized protein n=1 Tax=Arion vulgaris TaxID=1028688 RepID=A0A0B7BNL5_9EUPU